MNTGIQYGGKKMKMHEQLGFPLTGRHHGWGGKEDKLDVLKQRLVSSDDDAGEDSMSVELLSSCPRRRKRKSQKQKRNEDDFV